MKHKPKKPPTHRLLAKKRHTVPEQPYGSDYEGAARRAKLIARITANQIEIRREDDKDD